ncbi:MAG: outer membrane beta-barrel protein [Rickettsiales bacterium]|jgi:opacity protein-like surface antigen|nr:outer membrane beta-barrel protein [Rickettsiales bacterium]
MKKILVVLFLVCIASANAGLLPAGVYFGIRGGTSLGETTTEKEITPSNIIKSTSSSHAFGGVVAGLRLSLPFLNTIRAEVEGLGRYNNASIKDNNESKKISSGTGGVNIYYDVIDLPFIRGYVGGGLGYTRFFTASINGQDVSNGKSLAYNVGAGLTATLMDTISVDLGYRYFHQGEIKYKDEKFSIGSQDVYVSLRFGF